MIQLELDLRPIDDCEAARRRIRQAIARGKLPRLADLRMLEALPQPSTFQQIQEALAAARRSLTGRPSKVVCGPASRWLPPRERARRAGDDVADFTTFRLGRQRQADAQRRAEERFRSADGR